MEKVIEFLKVIVKKAYQKYYLDNIAHKDRKSPFDLVTEIDTNIEDYLIEKIKESYPDDQILSEETNSTTRLEGRTWTVDPIDGTINMAHSIKLYGVQLSLYEKDDIVLSYIYFPTFNEEYWAIKGKGAYKNGERIHVDSKVDLEDAVISYGDYLHSDMDWSKLQHRSIGYLYPHIARIRMFGTAALDFSYVASGATAGCVVITNNPWDILPGYLVAKEAGAILINAKGEPYKIGDYGLIAVSNETLKELIIKSLK